MNPVRQLTRDVTAALLSLVLFLFLLSQPIAPFDPAEASAAPLSAVSFSYCGDGPTSDAAHDHAGPCHACRFDVAVLPSPPSAALAAHFGFVAVATAIEDADTLDTRLASGHSARAPPVPV